MKALRVVTVASQQVQAHADARNALIAAAEADPENVAERLLCTPQLANGLKDFSLIVETLLKRGQRDRLTRMLDSRLLGKAARETLRWKLITMS